MSDGDISACVQDYNDEIIFGNVKNNSLIDIWNSSQYLNYRKKHIYLNDLNIKCCKECDMRLIGELI